MRLARDNLHDGVAPEAVDRVGHAAYFTVARTELARGVEAPSEDAAPLYDAQRVAVAAAHAPHVHAAH